MSEEITKQDWETTIRAYEASIVNNLIGIEFFRNNILLAKKKIAEFPDEKKETDPMPEGLKETIAEITPK